MTAYRNFVLRSALAALVLLSVSCAHRIQLRSPRNADEVQVGGQAGPQFTWRSEYMVWRPGDYQEYSLVVARDRAFKKVVFTKDKLDTQTYVINGDEGWLSGDTEYFWKVEGTVRDQDAEPLKELLCEKPRSFKLEKREVVQVSLSPPEGYEARVGSSDSEFTTETITVDIENGERRDVTIKSADGELVVSGHIWVVTVNDNTKYGKISIDNIEPEALGPIAKGDVGVYHYELGGERIVELKLGSKSLSSD